MADVIKDEIVLNDDELICVLTGDKKKANAKEQMLQSIILQMNEEYGFEMSDMKRDYSFRSKTKRIGRNVLPLIWRFFVLELPKSRKIWSASVLSAIPRLNRLIRGKVLKGL